MRLACVPLRNGVRMPRPNRTRTLGSERILAQRVATERAARDWTYDTLARRMTEVGCSIQASALYKIEKGDPPRRVTVDELVALANVFAVPMDELLVPVGLVRDRRARALVSDWIDAREELANATRAHEESEAALRRHLGDNPDSRAAVEAALQGWAQRT